MDIIPFDRCCAKIVDAAVQANAAGKRGGSIQYAASYAAAGLGMQGDARRVQALYILSNLGSWRGDEAKAVRTSLQQWSKK